MFQRAKTTLLKQYDNIKNNTINYAINLTEIIGAGDYRLGFYIVTILKKINQNRHRKSCTKSILHPITGL